MIVKSGMIKFMKLGKRDYYWVDRALVQKVNNNLWTWRDIMKKIIVALLVGVFFISSVGTVFAASAKCIVIAIEEEKVILDCGEKAKKFKVDTKVKIKTQKQKAIEGC